MTEREENILAMVEQHRYLERSMIAQIYFQFPTGQAKARQVLAKMHSRELLHRFRPGQRHEYVYHLDGKKSAKWRHWLDLNRLHFGLIAELKAWQRIIYWDFEVKYPGGLADGLYIVKTTLDSGVMFFLEMDDGANKFDKIQKYIVYRDSRTWKGEWWAQQWSGEFPLVLIVTPRWKEIGDLVSRCKEEEFFRVIRKENSAEGYKEKVLSMLK